MPRGFLRTRCSVRGVCCTMDTTAFQRSVQEGTPLADTYLMAVKIAQQVGAASSPKMADLLKARVIGDQMLRVELT